MWHLVLLRCIIGITLSSSKNTRSCHQAGRCYQNYQCGNLVLLCCIIGITLINFGGRVGCGLSGEYFLLLLDSTQSLKMHYKMQNNYFLRECENILNGYLYGGELLFVILKGIYGLNSPKDFWRSLPEISLLFFFFSSSVNLKTWLPNHWCLFPFHLQGLKPCKQQSTFSQ